MTRLPRIAVGTVQPDVEDLPIRWALLNLLERHGVTVQTFCSQARFHPRTGVSSVTGQNQRHLDSWLMSREMARELFYRGSRVVDLAVVEGDFRDDRGAERTVAAGVPGKTSAFGPREAGSHDAGGRLETLCDWLDLPRIAIVDAPRADCLLPERPEGVDGILLDASPPGRLGLKLQVDLEAIWGVPVLGRLPRRPDLRNLVAALRTTCPPSEHLCSALGDALAPSFNLRQLLQIASRRVFPATSARLFDTRCPGGRCHVAVAYDDAFHYYFPDTLDLLESWGARIRDFSPLHSERIPDNTDVIYLGCGQISPYAEELSANCCLKQSLRSFAASGGRIYAECAGLAYLCEHLILPTGAAYPMSGVFPAIARRDPQAGPPQPVEVPFAHDCWLGSTSSRLRGYYNQTWQIDPVGPLHSDAQGRLLSSQHAVGSRVHLDFAAQPRLLDRFFHPLGSSFNAIR